MAADQPRDACPLILFYREARPKRFHETPGRRDYDPIIRFDRNNQKSLCNRTRAVDEEEEQIAARSWRACLDCRAASAARVPAGKLIGTLRLERWCRTVRTGTGAV